MATYPNFKGVEYIPDERGTARKVKCPLINDWLEDIDCMESQAGFFLPKQKQKPNYQKICDICPFREY